MDKIKFIVGEQYTYKGTSRLVTYVGESNIPSVGRFESYEGYYHYEHENMAACAKTYTNLQLPHCEERIAFARGANIEFLYDGKQWVFDQDPKWYPHSRYRVKVEKTKDELLIERLQLKISNNERANADYKEELAKLKPTVHY